MGAQARFDVFCYDTAATAPTTPTGGTYNLATGVLTVPTGTTAAPVEPPTNQFSWRSQASINPATQSGSVTPTWSAFTTDVEEGLAARAEAAETGAETAQTAAEAAQTAAVAAQTAAGTAQTGAETAQTAAEAAEGRAEAAQSGAETALASSGAALAFNELWTGDLLLSAANQWHALGTEPVPSNATWLLWNGGTLTDGTNDGPAALWTWINAADWRALTADTVGTTAGDGTGMLFADWCASDIGDGTPDFTRRDAVIGRTSADIPLLMGPQTGESYFGARLMYITQAVATPGGGGGASSFADLTGMIADSQVPAAFTRDTELASLVDEVDVSGSTMTVTYQDGSTNDRTLPSGGGSDIAAQDEGTELTAALATINFVGAGVTAALRRRRRDGDHTGRRGAPANPHRAISCRQGYQHVRGWRFHRSAGRRVCLQLAHGNHADRHGQRLRGCRPAGVRPRSDLRRRKRAGDQPAQRLHATGRDHHDQFGRIQRLGV